MKTMKTIVTIMLAISLSLCLFGCGGKTSSGDETTASVTDHSETAAVTTAAYALDYLVLVNKQHKLPDDWEANVRLEDSVNRYGETYQVETTALKAFYELQKDLLENDGVIIELDSTYRSVKRQQEIWDEFEAEKGLEYAQKYVAVPGYSEHHTGLAIDICIEKDGVQIYDNDEMIAEREIFAVIHSKLADHGFILRYPEGKDDITGYSYEPWHFRYVGVDAAKEIAAQGLTLEEYLNAVPEAAT
ncbi:MAG: M15 family metallopeptidase [Clostridia bacterium]|nr:M15 family metallopeptidase [Clostridia bacterium]